MAHNTHYTFLSTITSASELHQQPVSLLHFAANMVQNSADFVSELVHNSLHKSYTKVLGTSSLFTVSSLGQTRLTPLMAQPYEVVNVTSGNTSGGQGTNKPPDKPNG